MAVSSPLGLALQVGSRGLIGRRAFLASVAGLAWAGGAGAAVRQMRRQARACILLWMAGGPSQFETFDPKPGAPTQGPTRAIATATPGIAIAEHWTKVAGVTRDLAIIRSMTSREGNHGRATYLLHTGYAPSGGIVHPGFGAIAANELGAEAFDLPRFVSIQGPSAGPSFLGVRSEERRVGKEGGSGV